MKTRWGPAAQMVFVVIGLAGAGPCRTTDMVIPAPQSSGAVVTQASRFYSDKSEFPCIVSIPDWQPYGQPSPRSTYVGFTNVYTSRDWGAVTCWRWRSHQYRGFVKFDLAPLQGREVVLATLKYRVHSTNTNAREAFPNSCALSLWVSTAPQTEVETPGDLVLDGIPDANGITLSINVTDAVRDWVAGRRPNHGFFIDG